MSLRSFPTGERVLRLVCPHGGLPSDGKSTVPKTGGRNAGIAYKVKFFHSSFSSPHATELSTCSIGGMFLEYG